MGKALVELIMMSDHEVYVASRNRKAAISDRVSIYDINRRSKDSVEELIMNLKPDVIIDNICFSSEDANIIRNIYSNHELPFLRHYIMISTFFVYNYSTEREGYIEGEMADKADLYTHGKVEAENIIFKSKMNSIASFVRFPFIISYDDYSRRFQNVLKFVRMNRDLTLSENSNLTMSFLSKDEASRFLCRLMSFGPCGFVDVANHGCLSFQGLCLAIARIFDVEIIICKKKGVNDIYTVKRNICIKNRKSKEIYSDDFLPVTDVLRIEINKWERMANEDKSPG